MNSSWWLIGGARRGVGSLPFAQRVCTEAAQTLLPWSLALVSYPFFGMTGATECHVVAHEPGGAFVRGGLTFLVNPGWHLLCPRRYFKSCVYFLAILLNSPRCLYTDFIVHTLKISGDRGL